VEEFVINLDYANISSLDELSTKEKYIVYFQYDYICELLTTLRSGSFLGSGCFC